MGAPPFLSFLLMLCSQAYVRFVPKLCTALVSLLCTGQLWTHVLYSVCAYPQWVLSHYPDKKDCMQMMPLCWHLGDAISCALWGTCWPQLIVNCTICMELKWVYEAMSPFSVHTSESLGSVSLVDKSEHAIFWAAHLDLDQHDVVLVVFLWGTSFVAGHVWNSSHLHYNWSKGLNNASEWVLCGNEDLLTDSADMGHELSHNRDCEGYFEMRPKQPISFNICLSGPQHCNSKSWIWEQRWAIQLARVLLLAWCK